MHNRTPYFSMTGLAFKESCSPYEIRKNIQIALEKIRTFAFNGTGSREAKEAIDYIERECPKVQAITEKMRKSFFDDDLFPDVDEGRLRRMKVQLCNDLDRRTGQNDVLYREED